MQDYLYDGSFAGLLTCVYHHYYTDKASGIFLSDSYQSTLLGGYMEVETEEDKASRVYEAIAGKISSADLRRIYKAYLSCAEDKENAILDYIVLGFKRGSSVSRLHGNQTVFRLQSIIKKVDVETERMLQFVRFSELEGGVMYSAIEPDNDVLELIGDHFSDRFRSQPFLIHDMSRDKALIATGGRWYIAAFDENDLPEKSDEEREYQRLWKTYFDHIAICQRTNPTCQRNFMPMRYRRHLTEYQIRDE